MEDNYANTGLDDKSEYSLEEQDNIEFDDEDYIVERHTNTYCEEVSNAVDLKLRNEHSVLRRKTEQGI